MDVGIQVLILAWILLMVVILQWSRLSNRGVSVATWLALTIVTWWLELTIAFVALHAILFSVGREATAVAIVTTAAIMVATPVAWAWGLGRWNKHRSAHP
jgi:hypothetical protein